MASNLHQPYVDHPKDIPARITLCSDPIIVPQKSVSFLSDFAVGNIGINFITEHRYAIGVSLEVEISFQTPSFAAKGRVSSCLAQDDGSYKTAIFFTDPDTVYSIRMIEQVCQIEHYRREIEQREGRKLSSDDAAQEWIQRFAKDFPCLSWQSA